MAQTTLQSLNAGLHRAFGEDERVVLLGEDVLDPYGGAFKVTAGLSDRFPDRVWTTPISEAAIVGMAAGMAMRGLRPVVEIMFGDFITLCADQLVNHAAKFRAMYNDQVTVPMVVRTPMGGGRGYGPTHSQSLEKMFLGIPDLTVVAPSHAHDPGALLVHALLEEPDPVLFIEHKLLYGLPLVECTDSIRKRRVPEANGYETILLENYAGGSPDVTLICYGGLSRICIPVMEELAAEEIRVLAALPSSLKPLPIETLTEAASRSGRVVIAEEGTAGFNWGSEVAAALYEQLWGRLKAPIRRLASRDSILPAAREMEDQVLLSPATLRDALIEALG
jgi:acetoin:2,6-dichlorophenolindophenol oxidoreductase subunit beta